MSDVVFLQDLELLCRVGVSEKERHTPRRLLVDLDAQVDCRLAAAADDVTLTVDYAALATVARQTTAAREYRLIETLAATLCTAVFEAFPRVVAVRVRVSKPGAVPGAQAVGVILKREREGSG